MYISLWEDFVLILFKSKTIFDITRFLLFEVHMDFHVMTLFPEMVAEGLSTSILGRAMAKNLISLECINIRDYSADQKHHKVDDYTYGGGAGMLMQAQPVFDCYKSLESRINPSHSKRVIYVTPQGKVFNQQMASDLARCDDLIFLCGHYEGIDERVLEEIVTDYISIGDYVLTGGELPAMVMIDTISRLVPGVLNNDSSAETESFTDGLLEYPQYSRPEEWMGKKVPSILLSGDHKKVDEWRLEMSLQRTKERRPELYEAWMAAHPPKPAKRRRRRKKAAAADDIEERTDSAE